MLSVSNHISLKPYHTFHTEVFAEHFAELNTVEDCKELLNHPLFKKSPCLILGGGSNVLFTENVKGLVALNKIPGINILSENEIHAQVKIGAGENWHGVVLWSLEKNLGGIENLSLIPGSAGAAPIQNIGAYGVELKEVLVSAEILFTETGEIKNITKTECNFGYRDSIFKHELKNKCIILSITLQLSKKPVFNLQYSALKEVFKGINAGEISLKKISDTICQIRKSKLPDPEVTGNAGSFFKNPEVSHEKFNQLIKDFPSIIAYDTRQGKKLAAGWLIEQCGWKGFRKEDAGVHPKQALVLVNYGNATGREIINLAREIKESVLKRFDIDLEMEVNVIG